MTTPEEATPESLIAEFIVEVSNVIKRYWPRLAEKVGFASAHMIMGALEQVKQKILDDLKEELLKSGFGIKDL